MEDARSSPPEYRCCVCRYESNLLQCAVDHHTKNYTGHALKIGATGTDPISGSTGWRSHDFGIVPADHPNCKFTVDDNSNAFAIFIDRVDDAVVVNILTDSLSEMSIGEMHEDDAEGAYSLADSVPSWEVYSPCGKKQRFSTPSRHSKPTSAEVHRFGEAEETLSGPTAGDMPGEETHPGDTTGDILLEMTHMLPAVMDALEEADQLDAFYNFNKMIYNGTFPVDNMSYLLFLDVCRFFSSSNTSSLRYSPVVKRFWRIGYRLFHGKWLRFMGGPKHGGSVINGNCENGSFNPEDAKINFAIPNPFQRKLQFHLLK